MLAQTNSLDRLDAPPLLYRQFFLPGEIAMLDRDPGDDPASEISLLRILISRVLASSRLPPSGPRQKGTSPLALKRIFEMLTAFCRAVIVMAGLVRLEFKRNPPPDPILAALAELDPDDL
jgi:hypothetical protein